MTSWRELVRIDPEQLGIGRARWTLGALQQVEAAWAAYSSSGLWRLLRALGIRYKRGRHYVHSPDPDYIAKRDAAQDCVEKARKEPEKVITYYLDEFSFYRQPTVAEAWYPAGCGQPLACRSHRSNVYHRVLGALNATTGEVVFRMARKTDVAFICRFLRHLRQINSEANEIMVILDNWYNVHNHTDVQETARQEGITLVYLPTYAPWLNPIEKLWRKAYQEVLHLHRYSDRWSELKQRMDQFLSSYSKPSHELLRYVGLLSV